MNLFETDIVGARVTGGISFSKDFGSSEEVCTFGAHTTVYDDKGNFVDFQASQEFTKNGLGQLNIDCDYDYDDNRMTDASPHEQR